jgi:hypothetical protein
MNPSRLLLRVGIVLALFLGAAGVVWTSGHRSSAPALLEGERISVSNASDSGPGSLREALFAVARSSGRAKVMLRIERIEIENPLPPILDAHGVTIESTSHTVIDATRLRGGPVLDFQTDDLLLQNVSVEHAPDVAILLRGHNAVLRGVAVRSAAVGIEIVAPNASVSISNCSFSRDGIAIKAQAAPSGAIEGNQFDNSQQAALWIVAGSFGAFEPRRELRISGNGFHADRDAILLGNVASRLELNKFSDTANNAIAILGGRTTIRNNGFQKVHGTSVLLENALAVDVSDNDISGGAGIAIMARAVDSGSVVRNRVYGNGYGLVQVGGNPATPLTWAENLLLGQHTDGVLVIGASPLLRLNRALNNQGAGIRVLSLLDAQGRRTTALPLLEGNVSAGNGINDVVRGDYRS